MNRKKNNKIEQNTCIQIPENKWLNNSNNMHVFVILKSTFIPPDVLGVKKEKKTGDQLERKFEC